MKLKYALIFLLLFSTPVWAQQVCQPREEIVSQLKKQYKEQQRIIGLSNDGTVLEIFSTKSGSSYTVTITRPDGITCVVNAGTGLEIMEIKDDSNGI